MVITALTTIFEQDRALSRRFQKVDLVEPSVQETIKILEKFVGENIPILDNDNKLIGIISENDVLKAYGEITESIRNIEKN